MGKFLHAILIFILSASIAHAKKDVEGLLLLDKKVKADSIAAWYKANIEGKDSSIALPQLNELQQQATAKNDVIALSHALFFKGDYTGRKLQRQIAAVAYMKKALDLDEREHLDYQWVYHMHGMGMYYFMETDSIAISIECVVRADQKFKELDYEGKKIASLYLYEIAYIYYNLNNYGECLNYITRARQYPAFDVRAKEQIDNTAGLCYIEYKKYDSAFFYFQKVLSVAKGNNDTAWIGIVNENIGSVYLQKNETDSALTYCETAYANCRLFIGRGTTGNAISTLIQLGDIYRLKNKPDTALKLYNEALGLIKVYKRKDYKRREYLFAGMAKLCALKNNYTSAFEYAELSHQIGDTFLEKQDVSNYINVQEQLESEKHIAQMDKIEQQKHAAEAENKLLLIAGALLFIVAGLVYNRKQLKAKKDREITAGKEKLLQSEKLRVEEELQNAKAQLEQYLKSINEKNELIEQIYSKIGAHDARDDTDDERRKYMEQLSQATLLTNDHWDEFKSLFTKVYKGFFVNLNEKYPGLTEGEMRIISLSKLNLTTKQMAGMLGISPSSVLTARYRLRKKMNLKEDIPVESVDI